MLDKLRRRWRATADQDEKHLSGVFSAHPVGEFALVVVTFMAIVAAATWPQVRDLYSVPDLGDPLFSVWRLSWTAHQLPRDITRLFDGNIFYPEKLTLTYSDSLLFPTLLAAPFFWLGLPHLPIYTVLLLSGFALSGVSLYYLARALTGRRDAAFVSGLIFALYPYRFEHYSHLELQMTMAAPLALWGLHRTLAYGRLRDGMLTGLAYALQLLSSLYYGLFLAVYLTVVGTTLWLCRKRPLRPLLSLALGAVLAGLTVLPVVRAYSANKPMFGERTSTEIEVYSARPGDYLIPHFRSALYGGWDAGGKPERQLFPGVVVIVMAIAGLCRPLGAARGAYLLALLVSFECSLGLHGLLYPLLHDYVSPFRGLRVPARFSILVGMTLAILAGYGLAHVLERRPHLRRILLPLVITAICVDCWPRLELLPVWQSPPKIYAAMSSDSNVVLAEFPVTNARQEPFDFRYEYFSTWHFHKLLNGNSGFFPPSWHEFSEQAAAFPNDASLSYLKSRGVHYFAVHGGFYDKRDDFERIQRTLSMRSDVYRVVAEPFAGGQSELYGFR